MHALRRIHAALVPGGTVVDTQPVSSQPRVCAGDGRLGALDMHEWGRTIDAVDSETARAIEAGLFVTESEHMIEVADEFDTGAEFVEVVGAWRGTRIPPAVVERAGVARPPVRVRQAIRLRILRSVPSG